MQLTEENADLLNGIVEQTLEMTEECLKTNYYGAKAVTEALIPLLQLTQNSQPIFFLWSTQGNKTDYDFMFNHSCQGTSTK